jgi:hypothetical protein
MLKKIMIKRGKKNLHLSSVVVLVVAAAGCVTKKIWRSVVLSKGSFSARNKPAEG